ncbi:hypothetical protein EDD11_000276 [Mortierella claussenii]|nr:hypothetical protein EDD11_000276 [Mortierella claussenii]
MTEPLSTVNDALALYQSKLVYFTRPFETFAHETLQNPSDPVTDQPIFAFINTLRIMLGDLAGQMPQSRREGGLHTVFQISLTEGPPLLSVDDLASRHRQAEAILATSKPVVNPKTIEKEYQDRQNSKSQQSDSNKGGSGKDSSNKSDSHSKKPKSGYNGSNSSDSSNGRKSTDNSRSNDDNGQGNKPKR